jgi:glycerol-3-phosphate dehydrogenase
MPAFPAFRAIVIGGGVVGCAVLYELARRGIDALLIESEPDIGEGTSKANSAIVHTGFDATPGTWEAQLLRRASALWPTVISDLEIPYLAVGALMLARTPEERDRLAGSYATNAASMGVSTKLLSRDELWQVAPYVTGEAMAALSIPGEGVIDPFWLTRAYAGAAVANGAELLLGRQVTGIELARDSVVVQLDDGSQIAGLQAFNCAGLASDIVARLGGDASFAIRPRKGQFLVSEETHGVDQIVLPLPGPGGKGMLVTPIVFGGLLLGPTAEDQEDKGDRGTTSEAREQVLEHCRSLVPAVEQMVPIRQFAGVRAVSSTGDYVLRPSSGGDRLFHVAGIRSTGISASPAIAEHVVAWAIRERGWSSPARTAPVTPPRHPGPDEAGEVVCLCRSISRGEVAAACRGPVGATTLDGLKRRCGISFGDCQGNLCAARAAQVAAAARDQPVEALLKHRAGSWLFATGPSVPAGGSSGDGPGRPHPGNQRSELLVIGGGLAGVGAALAALLIERECALGGAFRSCLTYMATEQERAALAELDTAIAAERVDLWRGATVVGLLPIPVGWRALVQDALGMVEIETEQVVLATGGYVQPREHLPIAGPRGSGVVTSDYVHAALDRGLLPGRSAVVVGGGRCARAATERLRAAGVEIRAELEADGGSPPVEEVRGDRRLQAVKVAEEWLEADTLVLAHRLLPAPFLLRGLGLVDGRPDQPAPVNADGATPLPGLWAAGSCVRPDIDHVASLADGLALGFRLAASRASAL